MSRASNASINNLELVSHGAPSINLHLFCLIFSLVCRFDGSCVTRGKGKGAFSDECEHKSDCNPELDCFERKCGSLGLEGDLCKTHLDCRYEKLNIWSYIKKFLKCLDDSLNVASITGDHFTAAQRIDQANASLDVRLARNVCLTITASTAFVSLRDLPSVGVIK